MNTSMSLFQYIAFFVVPVAMLAVPLLGVAGLLYALWRRRLKSNNTASDAPLGCRTSRTVETIAIAAGCVILLAFAATQLEWRNLLFSDYNAMLHNTASTSLSVWGAAATAVAVIGLLVAIGFAWRGAGTIAVVAIILAVFGYTAAVVSANRVDVLNWTARHRSHHQQEFPDLNLVLDIGGCNVVGANLSANGVPLGKTPVRIKLSELLVKVPDWETAPGRSPKDKNSSPLFASTDSAEERPSIPSDDSWGYFNLPDLRHISLPAELEAAVVSRKNQKIYVQAELDGNAGKSTGSSGGGGGDDNYGISIGFRFPKREAAIERLLNQARLADYLVDENWLEAAAQIGPDVWIAAWMATPNEPGMKKVLDAWGRWQYDLDDVQSAPDAWLAFGRIRLTADRVGWYVTSSPSGHAVEMLAPRLDPWQLIDAAEPLIDSITSVSYGNGSDGHGLSYWSVDLEDARGLVIPLRGSGMATSSGNDGRLQPSGLALAHAIWLTNRRLVDSQTFGDAETPYQQRLAPSLLRADLHRRPPYALMCATYLGGSAVEKFLIRKANWTRDTTWQHDYADFDWMQGTHINRWTYWAAQLPGPAGRSFRKRNEEELFTMANHLVDTLHGMRDDVSAKLPFLFVENELGPASIGRKYWPRFREIVERDPHDALDKELGYLIALGAAAEPRMYVDVVSNAWNRKPEQHAIVEFVQWRLPDVPIAVRADVLDGIIASVAADERAKSSTNWGLRELRKARYLEIDDAASVAYLLKWFRDELPKDEQPGRSLRWFKDEELPKMAARRPLLVAALATAPETDLRLLAISAIRNTPTPQNQELLGRLLEDDDERVRTAAKSAAAYWESLRSPQTEDASAG
jgi:hypothetical protein